MEKIGGAAEVRSANCGVKIEDIAMESLQFGEEIQRLMSVPPPPPADTGSSFTALLGLPATQAMELLHSPEPEESPGEISGDPWSGHPQIEPPKPYPIFPCNAALIDRASKFSVFAAAAADVSPVTSSIPSNSSANSHKVKPEPIETDSNPNSSPAASDSDPNKNPKSTKRKERENKGTTTNKKSKSTNETSEEGEKLPYVHVRARRGQATDSHSLAERARREKINARMKLLQELVPGCNKISGTAMVLDEIINHVQTLQRQVEILSMRLATVNPGTDFNLDNLFAAEIGSLTDISLPSMVMPSMWPEGQVNGSRQQYQQQLWHFDAFHQPVWGREEDHPNFITPENSLLSYDSSANSASLHANQLKMEL